MITLAYTVRRVKGSCFKRKKFKKKTPYNFYRELNVDVFYINKNYRFRSPGA